MTIASRLIPALLVLLAAASPAAAPEMVWSTGASDLTVTSSARCTLLVSSGPGRALPGEWRLLYVVDEGPAPHFAVEDAVDGFASACQVRGPRDQESLLGNVQVITHCATSIASRPNVARYILDLQGNVHTTFMLWAGDLANHGRLVATVNGGSSRPLPPLITKAEHSRQGGQLMVKITGEQLDDVVSVSYLGPNGRTLCVFEIRERGSNELRVEAKYHRALPTGVLQVATTYGTAAAIALSANPVAPLPSSAPGRLLVRFRDAEVEPPSGRSEGLIHEFSFRSFALRNTLTTLGVLRLERLLPWRGHSDARAVSVDGETIVLPDLANLYLAQVDSTVDLRSVREQLQGAPGVLYAHRDVAGHGMLEPNDPLYSQQWGLHNTAQPICGYPTYPAVNIYAPSAWDRTIGASTTRIAILDTGIDPNHPDFALGVDEGISFVPRNKPRGLVG